MCSTSSKAIFGKGFHLSHSARSATGFCSLFHFSEFSCGAWQTHAFLQSGAPPLQHPVYLWVAITWQLYPHQGKYLYLFLCCSLLALWMLLGEEMLHPLPWAGGQWERLQDQVTNLSAGFQKPAFICIFQSSTACLEAIRNEFISIFIQLKTKQHKENAFVIKTWLQDSFHGPTDAQRVLTLETWHKHLYKQEHSRCDCPEWRHMNLPRVLSSGNGFAFAIPSQSSGSSILCTEISPLYKWKRTLKRKQQGSSVYPLCPSSEVTQWRKLRRWRRSFWRDMLKSQR